MSYTKAMRHSLHKSRKQGSNHFGFCTLAANERRRNPWLGAAWFEPGKDGERDEFIAKWHADTEAMLKANPALKIIG